MYITDHIIFYRPEYLPFFVTRTHFYQKINVTVEFKILKLTCIQTCHQGFAPIPELFLGPVASRKYNWGDCKPHQGVQGCSPWNIVILDHLNPWKSHFQQLKRLLNSVSMEETALAINNFAELTCANPWHKKR